MKLYLTGSIWRDMLVNLPNLKCLIFTGSGDDYSQLPFDSLGAKLEYCRLGDCMESDFPESFKDMYERSLSAPVCPRHGV